jgi:rfaE bifunctional protein kinase chain/domain/rfaE bifunctional protein nucleotidyltransferase chain/domain
MINKIKNIEEIKKILNRNKKKVVLCHGTFDLLHLGHINHLSEAKNFGDILVVSLTSDKFVNKGPGRPFFTSRQRAEALSALKQVDYVTINKDFTSTKIIRFLKPNIYCKGPDYKDNKKDTTGEIKNEILATKSIRGKIIYTTGSTFSSSKLINSFSDNISKSQKTSINKINIEYSFSKIKYLIDKLKNLKVLVIGETIIDEYNFCEALGKSGKDPFLVFRDIKTEQYLGGAVAISKHLSQFCKKIKLLSVLGEKKEFLGEIKKGIPKNINYEFITKKNSHTILKKRYIDNLSLNKVLGVYKLNDDPLAVKEENILNKKLKKIIKKFDLVIVSDYGHGFISKKSANIICSNSKYLAVNAQINAANIGYHSMKKYKNCDCVIINEREIRQEFRDKNEKIENLMKKLSFIQKIKNLIVTRGNEGSVLFNKNKFYYSDAFAKKAVDKIGAGDAMLSLVSLGLKKGLSKELSLLLGSVAGAQSVEGLGNKESIQKIKIVKALEHILK